MAAKHRQKTLGANLQVPQSLDEATDAVGRIGTLTREIARTQADLNDVIADAKASAEKAVAPMREEVERLTEGVRIWAEANRGRLTDGGRVKFADLATGKILWRMRPPKVTVRGVDAVIAALKRAGLGKLIRTEESLDKEAMLRDPAAVAAVPGLVIGSAGEDFVIEPTDVALSTAVEPAAGGAA